MIWVYWRRERGGRPTVRFSDVSMLKAAQKTLIVKLRHSIIILRLIAIGLLIIALARPRKGNTQEEVSTEGVDIIVVLDVSTSMKALDFQPKNRLHVAKETTKEFITQRKHDRIGLAVFAGRSYTKCPLTLDYDILNQFIDEIDFGNIEDGTAIGTAIATSANRLRKSKAKSKILVLLTDGDNNKGEIAPLTAANAAAELGIKIYTIAIGKEGEVPYPMEYVNPWTGERSTQVRAIESTINEQSLIDIANTTGGSFFRAHNTGELKKIYKEIDSLEKTEIKTTSYTTYSEHFFNWLLAGAVVLLLEIILAHTRFRRIP